MMAEFKLDHAHEVWRLMCDPKFTFIDWVSEKNPTWEVRSSHCINGHLTGETVVVVVYELKSEDKLYRERFEYLMSTTTLSTLSLKKEHRCGVCPECDRYVRDWKPVFGGLAPEWWATMRENGIDPANGHETNCSKKNLKF